MKKRLLYLCVNSNGKIYNNNNIKDKSLFNVCFIAIEKSLGFAVLKMPLLSQYICSSDCFKGSYSEDLKL